MTVNGGALPVDASLEQKESRREPSSLVTRGRSEFSSAPPQRDRVMMVNDGHSIASMTSSTKALLYTASVR